MIYLDTHVVVWLYAGLAEKFSQPTKELLNENEIYISPIVQLELQYLHKIDRLSEPSNIIVADLVERIGMNICDKDFNAIVSQSMTISWTRAPFDRIIVANANSSKDILITKDENILQHYDHAKW